MKNCKVGYIVIPLVTLGIALLGYYFTGQGLEWYASLDFPRWTPSGGVVDITWALIFLFFVISSLLFCRKSEHDKRFGLTMSLFIDSLILNALRTRLFFVKHLFVLAIVDMILLLIVTVVLIIAMRFRSRWSAIILMPYALGLMVLTVSAIRIMILN